MNINNVEVSIKNKIDINQLKLDKEKIKQYFLQNNNNLNINEFQIIKIKNNYRTYLVSTSIDNNIVILSYSKSQDIEQIIKDLFNIDEFNNNQFMYIFSGITKIKLFFIEDNKISLNKDDFIWKKFSEQYVNLITEI